MSKQLVVTTRDYASFQLWLKSIEVERNTLLERQIDILEEMVELKARIDMDGLKVDGAVFINDVAFAAHELIKSLDHEYRFIETSIELIMPDALTHEVFFNDRNAYRARRALEIKSGKLTQH